MTNPQLPDNEPEFVLTYPDGREVVYVADEEPMYLWPKEKMDERLNYWFGSGRMFRGDSK